jgi:hypothetical protein
VDGDHNCRTAARGSSGALGKTQGSAPGGYIPRCVANRSLMEYSEITIYRVDVSPLLNGIRNCIKHGQRLHCNGGVLHDLFAMRSAELQVDCSHFECSSLPHCMGRRPFPVVVSSIVTSGDWASWWARHLLGRRSVSIKLMKVTEEEDTTATNQELLALEATEFLHKLEAMPVEA